MALLTQPANINFLSPLGFQFSLSRSPSVNFFVTEANLPSISLGFVEFPTPFKNLEIAGNKLEMGSFNVTFRMDEDFSGYFEIYNWIIALGFPDSFSQYKTLSASDSGTKTSIYSDAELTILTSAMVPNIQVTFQDLYPISLSDVEFRVTDTDVNYITATVEFKYRIFTVSKI